MPWLPDFCRNGAHDPLLLSGSPSHSACRGWARKPASASLLERFYRHLTIRGTRTRPVRDPLLSRTQSGGSDRWVRDDRLMAVPVDSRSITPTLDVARAPGSTGVAERFEH